MQKLRHIVIAAEDPEAMAEFYRRSFDLNKIKKSVGPSGKEHWKAQNSHFQRFTHTRRVSSNGSPRSAK